MASLTKMMTALVCLQLCDEFHINMKTTYFPVTSHSMVHGTSAFLVDEQVVSVHDLLRGLMLPSGNDAALCLAENFGARIMNTKRPGAVLKPFFGFKRPDQSSDEEDEKKENMGRERIGRFVKEMNRVAQMLNLKFTEFANPHGLSSKANHSTAFELGKLAAYAMKYSREFFAIVNSKVHNAVTYLPI